MSKSYQHEIPMARVNITLDVESNGAQLKKELPMKLLMLGNYSHGQATGAIADRDRVSINKNNFDQTLATYSPRLEMLVADHLQQNGEEMPVQLTFNSFGDFKPEQIVGQVPQLQKLMAMRNLLKDLKSCVIDNHSFRKALEKIMQNKGEAEKLFSELSRHSPLAK